MRASKTFSIASILKLEYKLEIYAPETGGVITRFIPQPLKKHKDGVIVAVGILSLLGQIADSNIFNSYLEGRYGKSFVAIVGEIGKSHRVLSIDELATLQKGCVQILLEKETDELLSNGEITVQDLRQSFEAKNRIIDSCIKEKGVQGYGFLKEDDFPVQRKQFSKHLAIIPEEEGEVEWWIDDEFTI